MKKTILALAIASTLSAPASAGFGFSDLADKAKSMANDAAASAASVIPKAEPEAAPAPVAKPAPSAEPARTDGGIVQYEVKGFNAFFASVQDFDAQVEKFGGSVKNNEVKGGKLGEPNSKGRRYYSFGDGMSVGGYPVDTAQMDIWFAERGPGQDGVRLDQYNEIDSCPKTFQKCSMTSTKFTLHFADRLDRGQTDALMSGMEKKYASEVPMNGRWESTWHNPNVPAGETTTLWSRMTFDGAKIVLEKRVYTGLPSATADSSDF